MQCIFPWISSEGDNVGNEDSSETEDLTQNEEEIPSTKTLDNDELNDFIMDGLEDMSLKKGLVFGSVETYEGFDIAIICQEIKLNRVL